MGQMTTTCYEGVYNGLSYSPTDLIFGNNGGHPFPMITSDVLGFHCLQIVHSDVSEKDIRRVV